MELQQVLDAERLEKQNDVGQVRPLDLRDRRGEQLVPVLPLGVEAVADAGPGPAGAAASLVRVGLRHGEYGEGVHADARVEHLE